MSGGFPGAATLAQDLDLSGRRVLVTGAAGGLGQALARGFAAAGARLVLADRDAEGLAAFAGALGQDAERHVFDQEELASIAALAEAAGTIDILVNNAGVLLVKPLLETEPEAMRRVIAIDLVGPMVLARHLAAGMTARRRGVIINISSQLAFCGAEGRAVYAAAKAGLAQFTKTAAVEWGPFGVRVVAIAPGRLLTPMTTYLRDDPALMKAGIARVPVGRYGSPEEIAKLAVFLASPAADYIVGETIIADGGYIHG
jgi:NAD(P)-dependent dehydrogenase (short-subunit alcohol dehydrogenase family)